ncbi:MAG: ComF family protein [Flavobacteriaceae bacterium]
MKYRGQKQLGAYFGTLLGKELKSSINNQTIDAIIPVPLHQKRQRKRGYNQVSLFGKTIAHYLGVPYIEDALVRPQNTKQLVKNYYEDREKILENAFCLNLNDSVPKHWLLVDDIITTGAALNFCGRLILENPKNELSIAAIGYRI